MTELVLVFGTLSIALLTSISIGAAFGFATMRRHSKDS